MSSKSNYPEILTDLLEKNEDWLMERILMYAKGQGYTAYTSTLKEAWRLSISGLSGSIIEGLSRYSDIPEIKSEEHFSDDPVARFGIIEAQRHKNRGVSLKMFLGLMKYYRQAYIDLIRKSIQDSNDESHCNLFLNRIFDRIEIGFCTEWASEDENNSLYELQNSNRLMTNEKNKYLTIFESIPNPVILLSHESKIDNMNFAAVKLFKDNLSPGSQYYRIKDDMTPEYLCGMEFYKLLPWLKSEVEQFIQDNPEPVVFEKNRQHNDRHQVFRVKLSKNLDVSGKYVGTIIILEDITSLKEALENIKQLGGLLPICASCKKIRDDKGYWKQIEGYIQEHSDAQFSHGMCPKCSDKLYGKEDWYIEMKNEESQKG